MALGNNIVDMTPGYMCHQNGNCHFYRYPLLSNTLPSISVPKKPHHIATVESSSSEEGRKALVTSKQQRVSLISPSSSPQSSPYASPPQSLSPSRAASPRESNPCSNFQSVSVSCVTGTTTSVVISKASPRPPSRHCSSSSSSGNGSHSSSPALAGNAQTYRNKPTVTSKSLRYSNNRCNARRGGPLNAQENVTNQQVTNSDVTLTKVNAVGSCSNNQVNEEHITKNSSDISLSIATSQLSDRTLPSSASSTSIPVTDQTLIVTSAGCLEKSLRVTNVPINELGKSAALLVSSYPIKCEQVNDSDLTSDKPVNVNLDLALIEEKIIPYKNGESHEYHSIVSVKNTAEGKQPSNLVCGLNGFANPSSVHSVPVITSVASGSCSHMQSPSSISHLKDGSNYDSPSQIREQSSQGNPSSDNVDLNSECDLQPLKNGSASFCENISKDCEVSNVVTSLVNSPSSSTTVALPTHSTSNLASGKSIVSSSNLKTSVNQTSNKCLPNQLKEHFSSGYSQPSASMGSKSSGITSVYATTTTNSTASMVPIVASNGTYPPFYSLPMIPGGNSPYLIQGGFPHPPPHGSMRAPSQAYFMASPSNFVHGHPNHFMKGGRNPHMLPPPTNFNGNNVKSRVNGCGRSGSSSSSSSGMGRKKTLTRGVTFPNKSLSSDSSPSSSQYSSPPQTPSPDHTKDVRRKAGKPQEPYPQEDGWEQADSKAPCMSNPPPHDDVPILSPMSSHMMMPSNPIRQRYIQFPHPLGYVGYPPPHPGMMRYSLTAPMAMGPRPPTPLNGEKSNRETTPPSHPLIGGAELSHKPMDYSNSTSRVPTSIPYNCNIPVSSHSSGSSSSSPPVVPTPNADTSNVALVPPPGSSAVHSCSQNGSMHYNPPSYQMFAMSAGQYIGHLPGIFSSPSTAMPNSYVSPHSLPPNFPLSSMGNVINSELMYPGQYPVMGQATPSISSCMHPSNGPVYAPLYHTPPPATVPIPPPMKKPQSCYNCGRGGHRGSECKEASMDDLTKHTKLL